MEMIIKSGKKNWSGKEFSEQPAKIYSCFDDATQAITAYHFRAVDPTATFIIEKKRTETITFVMLTERKKYKLLSEGKIRW